MRNKARETVTQQDLRDKVKKDIQEIIDECKTLRSEVDKDKFYERITGYVKGL